MQQANLQLQTKPLSNEQFEIFTIAWKQQAHGKNITGRDMLIYNAIHCRPINTGFTPLTNPKRIENGHRGAFSEHVSLLANTIQSTFSWKSIYGSEQLNKLNEKFGGVFTDQTWKHIQIELLK